MLIKFDNESLDAEGRLSSLLLSLSLSQSQSHKQDEAESTLSLNTLGTL